MSFDLPHARRHAPVLARHGLAAQVDALRSAPPVVEGFLRDSGGTGFWQATYTMRGGMEAIYDDITPKNRLHGLRSRRPARGSMFTAARRSGLSGGKPDESSSGDNLEPVVSEKDLYGKRRESRRIGLNRTVSHTKSIKIDNGF